MILKKWGAKIAKKILSKIWRYLALLVIFRKSSVTIKSISRQILLIFVKNIFFSEFGGEIEISANST